MRVYSARFQWVSENMNETEITPSEPRAKQGGIKCHCDLGAAKQHQAWWISREQRFWKGWNKIETSWLTYESVVNGDSTLTTSLRICVGALYLKGVTSILFWRFLSKGASFLPFITLISWNGCNHCHIGAMCRGCWTHSVSAGRRESNHVWGHTNRNDQIYSWNRVMANTWCQIYWEDKGRGICTNISCAKRIIQVGKEDLLQMPWKSRAQLISYCSTICSKSRGKVRVRRNCKIYVQTDCTVQGSVLVMIT